jgi:hypothetical protein
VGAFLDARDALTIVAGRAGPAAFFWLGAVNEQSRYEELRSSKNLSSQELDAVAVSIRRRALRDYHNLNELRQGIDSKKICDGFPRGQGVDNRKYIGCHCNLHDASDPV